MIGRRCGGGLNGPRALAHLVLLGLVAWCGGACDDSAEPDFIAGQPPEIVVTPTAASFPVVVVGETDEAIFTIENVGAGELRVTDMTLSGSGAEMYSVFVDIPGSGIEPYVDQTLVVEPETGRTDFQVVYAPTRPGTFSATLRLQTNDPQHPVVAIELNALETGPRLQITPSPLVFGQVAAGEEAVRAVTVTNVGSAEAPITGIAIAKSPDFTPVEGTRDDVDHPYRDTPLPVGESFEVEVRYAPPTQSRDDGSITVDYLFGDVARDETGDIIGNGNEPCIQVRPTEVDFGSTVIGTSAERVIDIENCGANALTVTDIALDPESSAEIELREVPDNLQTGGVETIDRGKARQVRLVYTPVDATPASGLLQILSDDPARPVVDVTAYGVGTFNECPTAMAGGRVVKDAKGNTVVNQDPDSDQFAAEPLSTIELTAAGTTDPNGDDIATYAWSIVEAPAGFSLGFTNPNAPQTELQLALVGDYIFELNVTDVHGMPACDPARVAVRVRSDLALIVELTWETPSDADETDTSGTDLDLHMLSPASSAWSQAGTNGFEGDTYFANANPEWGNHSADDDNPALDRDDTDGGGPEQINIRRPAYTDGTQTDGYDSPYLVGVYFYDDNDFEPPVYATIRVYTDGSDVPTAVWPEAGRAEFFVDDPSLARQGDFWLAGAIDWSSGGASLTEINTMQTGYP